MKNKLTLILCFGWLVLSAQETDKYVHRYIGIGIRASVFHISELPLDIIPANRLMVSYDPIRYLRTEVHVAAYSHTDELFLGTSKFNLKESSTLVGFGVFGVLPCENAKFLAGIRCSRNNYMEDFVRFDENGDPFVAADEGQINIVAPVLGGEYFFSKWFSVGAEFSFMMIKDELNPWDTDVPSTTMSTTITESSLVFRFYPY